MDIHPQKSRFPLAFSGERNSNRRNTRTTLWEACLIAVDSIWNHKLRSILTLLGIIIGIASVVTVGGAIEGLGSWVSGQLSSVFASNTFTVSRFARTNVSSEDFETIIKRNKNIYPEDMQAVEDKCEGCVAISPMMRATDDAKRSSQIVYDANVSGVSADMPKIRSLDLAEGRFVSEFDVTHSRPYAVIGAQIRDELFGSAAAIGKDIKLGGENFAVIGVEVRNGTAGDESQDTNIYIPYTVFLKKYGLRRSIQFQVRAPSETTLETTQDEVRQILRARHKLKPSMEDDFDILSSSAVQDMVGSLTGAITVAIIPITLISMVVAGIVVMNIMLVTVTERTVEIGMRKAVGARQSDILLQFLIESALLASIGGSFGVFLSYVVCTVIEAASGVPMRITIGYILMAILTSGGIGIVSGLYPAYKASKLNPIVALTKE